LDGILESTARRRALGDGYYLPAATPPAEAVAADPHGSRDPTVRAYRDRQRRRACGLSTVRAGASAWVWTASCAHIPDDAATDLRRKHKRFRSVSAEVVVDRLPANTDVGVTKAERIPLVATVVSEVTWWAIGDPTVIQDLLGDVVAVGASTASGEGMVTGWDVHDHGPCAPGLVFEAAFDRVMWRDDGRIGRPLPATRRTLDLLGLDSADSVRVNAYRPPYWRAAPDTNDGRFLRRPVEVIAPWTTKP
jgi:hypothetical protein